ncbi:hypothetical protein DFJ73DRAFT_793699 [Zopfochytrium polystomum]|nr:hypothetical protein DFJ73DRAFT_793699 [Zopfochytrium polystomum]
MATLYDWNAPHLVPFAGPVSPTLFTAYAFAFLSAGFVLACLFFIYEMNAKSSRSIVRELGTAGPSAILLGFGTVFLFNAIGIYV